jgi:hypothetical protein
MEKEYFKMAIHYKYLVGVTIVVKKEDGTVEHTMSGGNYYYNERLKAQGWKKLDFLDKLDTPKRRGLLAGVTDMVMRTLYLTKETK